jgi:hypothetical protein
MRRLKRALELLCVLVFFPMALLLAIDIAIAVSLTGLFAYLGGLLAAWLLFAYVVPLATGIITTDEIVAGIRSQRRQQFEGEPLPVGSAWWARWKPKPVEVESLSGGESLPEDRALWFPWKPGESDSAFG